MLLPVVAAAWVRCGAVGLLLSCVGRLTSAPPQPPARPLTCLLLLCLVFQEGAEDDGIELEDAAGDALAAALGATRLAGADDEAAGSGI